MRAPAHLRDSAPHNAVRRRDGGASRLSRRADGLGGVRVQRRGTKRAHRRGPHGGQLRLA
eukprot:2170606-Pleurochrysis_carterae.AAC.1